MQQLASEYRASIIEALDGRKEMLLYASPAKFKAHYFELAFQTASDTIRIYEDAASNELFKNPTVEFAARDFLNRYGKIELFPKGINSNVVTFVKILQALGGDQVDVRIVPQEISTAKKFNLFTVDDRSYHIQNPHDNEGSHIGGKGCDCKSLIRTSLKFFEQLKEESTPYMPLVRPAHITPVAMPAR